MPTNKRTPATKGDRPIGVIDVMTVELLAIDDLATRREAILAARERKIAEAKALLDWADSIVARLAATDSQRRVAEVTGLSKSGVQKKASRRNA